jgi:hypothetical protein
MLSHTGSQVFAHIAIDCLGVGKDEWAPKRSVKRTANAKNLLSLLPFVFAWNISVPAEHEA